MDIKEKRKELKSLSDRISHKMSFPVKKETAGKVQELQDRLEFRLKELNKKFTEEEADIKLEIFRQVFELLNVQ